MLICPDSYRDGSSPRGAVKKRATCSWLFLYSFFEAVMSYCVYIPYSSSIDRYYIGMTENLQQGISQHNNPISLKKFTAKGNSLAVIYSYTVHQ